MADKSAFNDVPLHQKAILQTVAHKHVREVISAGLKEHHINITQWMVLGVVNEAPEGQKISAVAKALQVEVPLITTLSQDLVKQGYLSQRQDANDRRSKPVSLTANGRTLLDTIETQLTQDLQLLEAGLQPEELTQYFATLRTFISNAEQNKKAK